MPFAATRMDLEIFILSEVRERQIWYHLYVLSKNMAQINLFTNGNSHRCRDFCILVLYSANLLNSLMSSSSFLEASLGFSVYNIMLSGNNDGFASSFSLWISVSCF